MTAFWEQNIHPITGYKHSSHDNVLLARKTNSQINRLKPGEFDPDLWIETKELMQMFDISSNVLSVKIKELGFVKITHLGKKYVEKEIVKLLK